MTDADLRAAAAEASARAHAHLFPSARKTGRRSEWPYVPIVTHGATVGCPAGRTEQLLGLAYATRAEAVARAEAEIAGRRARLEADLVKYPNRALREWHGLPREIPRPD